MVTVDLLTASISVQVVLPLSLPRLQCDRFVLTLSAVQDFEFNTFAIHLTNSRGESHAAEVKPDGEETGAPLSVEVGASAASLEGMDDPLAVKVALAGEVEGLKPPAVARNPRPPRLFVVERDGQAEEVLSIQDVALREHSLRWNPDASKVVDGQLAERCGSASLRQLHYLTRR